MVYIPTAEANLSNSRFEKSLALLTSRFMDLLQQSPTGILDIKEATEILQVPQAQRRRIYDITNVLEGIGLIEKQSKQCIRWKGASAEDRHGPEAVAVAALNQDIEMLNQHEKMLDMQLAVAQQNLMNTVVSDIHQAYVTLEDLCGVFPDNTLVAVKAPSNTDMDINRHQVHLKAISGRINALMVEKDDDNNIQAASVGHAARPVVFGPESFGAKRKVVGASGPPAKRSRLYGASENAVGHHNLMEDIENFETDVFSYSPQSSSYSPQSSLGGDYVTFNMGSVEAESPTFSIESLEEGSTKFSFDSSSQGFNSSPESSFEGVNRAGMTERYVDSLEMPRTFVTQNGAYSNPEVSSNSLSPGVQQFGSMSLAPPPTRPRTIISARPVTIGSRIMSSRPVSVIASQQNAVLAIKQESLQQPSSFEVSTSSSSPEQSSVTVSTSSLSPQLSSFTVSTSSSSPEPSSVTVSTSSLSPEPSSEPEPSSFTVSTSSSSPEPSSVTIKTSDSPPGVEQTSSPPADFGDHFDDNELDLLMQAVQELGANSSPEKDAVDSETVNTFSLDYLEQDAYDMGDAGDMFDDLQKNSAENSSCTE